MKSMGVATGCGCKEVYRFPHTTYPYSSCICSFLQQHPYFLFIFLNVFRSLYIVVTDFRLHHTCSIIIILLWLHSLSGVIRSLLCNPRAFRQCIIIFRISMRRRSCGIPRAHVRKYGNMYMYDCHWHLKISI